MAQLIASTEITAFLTAFEIEAPDIAAAALPGHMVLFRLGDQKTPVPCAITDCNTDKGTVTIVARGGAPPDTGATPIELAGPLGQPAEEERTGKIVCVADGLGVAALLPRLREYKQKGWYTQVIAGYPSRDTTFWTDRLNEFSDELYIVTEDGSLGIKGPIRHTIKAVCDQTADIDRVFAVGPLAVLKATSDVTRKNEIPTWISLNAVFDGNGAAAGEPTDGSPGGICDSATATGPAGGSFDEPGDSSPAIGPVGGSPDGAGDGATATGDSSSPAATDDNQPAPAFDWSEAADLNGHEQDFGELAEKLGIQIKK